MDNIKNLLADTFYEIDSVLLDPNNPRLNVSEEISEDKISDPSVQSKTLRLISGKGNSNLSDLISSFKQHSYIPTEKIIVRDYDKEKAVVIEGNRRLATLKYLKEKYENGDDIGNFDPEIFNNIPVICHKGDNYAIRKVIMGLKHISGSKKWSAINQARFIEKLMSKDSLTEEEICDTYTISKVELRTTLRTLSLIELYKKSDYGDNFADEKYSTFREIVKSPKIKEWLNLTATSIDFSLADQSRLYRLFSFISPVEVEEIDPEDEDEYITNVKEPIIETALQIRELAKIIDDEKALTNLETTRNLLQATLSSEVLGKNKLENALSIIDEQINIAFGYSFLIDEKQSELIQACNKKINALLVTRNKTSDETSVNPFSKKPIVESCLSHFTSLRIEQYKRFNSLNIENLNQVNIFAGINNAGKSSILEAFYILTKLGDTQAFQNMNRNRKKHYGDLKNSNTFNTLPRKAFFSAEFNRKEISLHLFIDNDFEIENMSGFIGRFTSECKYINKEYSYHSDYYEKKVQHYASSNNSLCNSVISFSSSIDDEQVFIECYKKSISNGAKVKVINFIRENIDSNINDVELSDNDGTFIVVYDDSSQNMDLSLFGDGLQKIFYLGIKFAACSNGIILLDEIENGIHKIFFANLRNCCRNWLNSTMYKYLRHRIVKNVSIPL
ncbi:AAA family ATPase [Pseudoalteromonas viridis]|uniref:AAA family ATPase n=1 Tax=Pseudoalteromonas viridis TaxID=339617 RepID=A0ABX7V508_9GAMM|nr:AAA family ATPase [Pseudoalteromonas viridis]QTL35966.1 AAA family ATPase [Pseudoalteromonas viridis]